MRLRFLLPCASLLAACPSGNPDDDDSVTTYNEVAPGALVFTEVMANPQPNRGEYVELYNTTGEAIGLAGCQVSDGGSSGHDYVIATDAEVAPGGYVLLGSTASLGPEENPIDVAIVWADIALNQSDDTESVTLACPDGNGGRSITDSAALSPEGGWPRGRAWQFEGTPSASGNDDPAGWCTAPNQVETRFDQTDGLLSLGTPGAPTVCETPGGATPSLLGQLVITEISIDPCADVDEWFELWNPGLEALDIRRCAIYDGPADGSSEPAMHVIDAERGGTAIPAGGYLLLKAGTADDTSLGLDPSNTVSADYPYADSIGFNNSGVQSMWIECPTDAGSVEIDRIVYNWENWGSSWKGRSLQVDPPFATAEGNDDAANWCVGSSGPYLVNGECSSYGTPGDANPPCPIPDPSPGVGEVVITELMARSDAVVGHNEEWFEVKNVSAARVGLDGCIIEVDDGDGTPDQHVVEWPLGVPLDPGGYGVLVKSSAADSLGCGLPYIYQFGTNISFINEAAETLRLRCPGAGGTVTVDEVPYDGGFSPGIPWQLMSGSETAAANDLPASWCNATSAAAWTWSCTVTDGADTGTNYGTPGAPSVCP
jgi:hypothetical protein